MGTTTHRITISASCRHKRTDCRPGYEPISKRRSIIIAARDSVTEYFDVSGVACKVGCERPCTIAYHGTRKATDLFGGIEPNTDIDDLLAVAWRCAVLGDGWCSSMGRPRKRFESTHARVPTAIIALEDSDPRAS